MIGGSRVFLVASLASLPLWSCDAAPVDGAAASQGLEIAIAPMTLLGITDACYALTVFNGDPDAGGEVVWGRLGVCASQFGADGSVTFIGPCDADPDGRDNHVQLALTELYDGGTALDATPMADEDFKNPCPASSPCEQVVACRANADARVVFDLTVMRPAQQGFFDVAVNFDDIFCSAKLDCTDADTGAPIELLFNGDERDTTLVLGFTCAAASSDGPQTHLYLDELVLTCAEGTATVDPGAGPGNLPPEAIDDPDGLLFGAATYQGATSPGLESRYWNAALGFLGGTDCTFTARGTASTGLWASLTTPERAIYPVIVWSVDVTTAATLTCSQHAIDGDPPGVATGYTDPTASLSFAAVYPPPPSCADDAGACRVFVTADSDTLGDIGMEGADARCQERADLAGLGGRWLALMSCATCGPGGAPVHARDKIPDAEYRLLTDALVATDKADLFDGDIASEVRVDELGSSTAVSPNDVWTGTRGDGTAVGFGEPNPGFYDCDNWTTGDDSQVAVYGQTHRTSTLWIERGHNYCSVPMRLFCFEI